MPCEYGHIGGQVSTPARDFNVQTPAAQATGTANPPIPADHAQQSPEFLQKLIREVNRLRQEQSVLWAKRYPPHPPITHESSHIPPYEQEQEWRRQDEEYDRKISALKMQIQELHTLLARPAEQRPEPETEQVPGPTSPPTSEPSEAARGV